MHLPHQRASSSHLRRAGGCLAATGSGLGFWPGFACKLAAVGGDTGGVRDRVQIGMARCTGEIALRHPTPIQAGSRWDVKRTHARMDGCGKLRCCTGRPRRDEQEFGGAALPAVAGPPECLADAPPGGGDGVAGSRPSVRACGSGARGDEHRDRGSNLTAPPHCDPAAPSHVPRYSLKGTMAVLLGRRERWRRWDVERSDLSMFAPTG